MWTVIPGKLAISGATRIEVSEKPLFSNWNTDTYAIFPKGDQLRPRTKRRAMLTSPPHGSSSALFKSWFERTGPLEGGSGL